MRIKLTFALVAVISVTLGAVPSAGVDQPPLSHEAVIEASVDDVWAAFTTRPGLESWMAAYAEIDLRIGGRMSTHYDRQGALGDPATIENTIIAYEPKRMLATKVSKPPSGFPFANAVKNMWTIVYFDALGPQKTRVRSIGLGFGDDEESLKMREFFDRGNAFTLLELQKHFAAKAPGR